MKKNFVLALCLICVQICAFAQDEPQEEERKGFKPENLFTGGTISLSFYNNSFLVGGNPVFGYSLTKWADLGLVFNYTYMSQHDYPSLNDKFRQSVYGGGVFTRLFPVRFLFAQAQFEHNWITQKYIYSNNVPTETYTVSGNSVLVGAGYTTGRDPESKNAYGYFAVLFDVSGNHYSPYTDYAGHSIPIFRAGVDIPLFQGKKGQ